MGNFGVWLVFISSGLFGFGFIAGTNFSLLAFLLEHLAFLFDLVFTREVERVNECFFLFCLFLYKLRGSFTYICVVKNILNHFVFCLVAVLEVLLTLFVLAGLLVFFFLYLDGPAALGQGLSDLLARSEDVRGDKWELMSHIVVVFVGGVESGVVDEFLER